MAADKSWIIGKDAKVCAIVVDDEYASGVHCRVDRIEYTHQFVVSDLGSTNGTYIEDTIGRRRKVVGPQLIEAGETLIVGRSRLPWMPGSAFVFERAEPSEQVES